MQAQEWLSRLSADESEPTASLDIIRLSEERGCCLCRSGPDAQMMATGYDQGIYDGGDLRWGDGTSDAESEKRETKQNIYSRKNSTKFSFDQ